MAGRAGGRLVDVDGVGVADGLGEATDVAALDVEDDRRRLATNVWGETGVCGCHAASIDLADTLVKRLALVVVEQVDRGDAEDADRGGAHEDRQ